MPVRILPTHPRPWHRASQFCAGPRVPLDRERRARFRFLLHAHHGAGRITRAFRDVGTALLTRLGVDGQCDPSHETLAADVQCKPRTVRRATACLKALGLLRWQTRLVRNGWRAEQTSNAYELVTTGANPPENRAPRCGGQNVRETCKKAFSSLQQPALNVSPAACQEAREALARVAAQRQAAVQAKLLGKGGLAPA